MNPLEGFEISPEILRLVAEVDELKGRWEALRRLAPDRLAALRRVATIESVGSSTRIEGAKLTDDEVDRLLSNLTIRSFSSRDEEEVAGYAQVMELVFESFWEIPLTENHLRQLHGVLLRHSTKDERHRGGYKTLPNHVEAFDEHGKSLGVVFETATPFDTPRLMEELVRWTNDALERGELHPILVIGVFVVRFLAIHPFQDGNGRLARIVTTLLLLRAGYGYAMYASLERVIEAWREDYYRALRRGQTGDLAAWILFFARALAEQGRALRARIDRERLLEKATLGTLDAEILRLIEERRRATLAEIVTATHANRNTAKAHLRALVASGKLALRGRGRGSWYEPG